MADDPAGPDEGIELRLTPRVCAVPAQEKTCTATVVAEWKAAQNESLCLFIVQKPEVKRCWEHYASGNYRLELTFDEDQVFELRAEDDDQVLTSKTLKIIREALEFRHRRRTPWNIF